MALLYGRAGRLTAEIGGFRPGAGWEKRLPLAEGVSLGLGRVVALYCRSSTSYRNREHIQHLYF
jgi:hypothetical protein